MLRRALLLVTLTQVVATALAAQPAWPLKIGPGRRYLTGQDGHPFLVDGDTAWSLVSALTGQEAERYLEDRRQKGVNAIIVNLIEHFFNGPVNREGNGPFTVPGDFTKPNDAYFAHADKILRRAAEKGITVFLFPLYLGYQGTDEGWYQETLLNGTARCREYGRYLGKRYKDFPNIVWVMGGDRVPGAAEEAVNAVAEGIREFMPEHLFSAHAAPEFSGIEKYSAAWLDINTTYTYGIVHKMLLKDYNHRPVMPLVFMESTYEGEHNASPLQIRRQAYWALLCGAAGQFLGNRPIWGFFSGWEAALDSQGSRDMVHVKAAFESRRWYELVPDQQHKRIVEGLGEFNGMDYLAAAATPDGKLLMAYIPTPRNIVIDTAELAGPSLRVSWFDPRSGKTTSGGEIRTGKRESLRTPEGGDWLLIVE